MAGAEAAAIPRVGVAAWRKADALACAVLAAVSLALCVPRLSGPIDLRYDAAVYYMLGTSLAEGKGYRLLSEPGEIAAVQYPPLLPALVAAHQMALGTADPLIVGQALRITYLLLWTGVGFAVYFLARRYLPPPLALLAAGITHLHVHNLFMSDMLFAETPFALATVLFFLISRREGWGAQWRAAPLAVAAFLLRSVGIALLGAWVAERLLKRRYGQAALAAAVSLVPFLLWQGYLASVKAGPEYANPHYEYQRAAWQYANVTYQENIVLKDPFTPELGWVTAGELALRVVRNLGALPVAAGDTVSVRREFLESQIRKVDKRVPLPLSPEALAGLALGSLGLLSLGGLALLLKRREWGIPLYVAGSVLLICLTPWPGQFPRYLQPLSPFLILSLVLALSALTEVARRRLPHRPARLARGAAVAVVTGILLGQLLSLWLVYNRFHQPVRYAGPRGEEVRYRLFFYGRGWPDFDQAVDWVKARAAPGEVVATSIPHWTSLRTGLKAVMPPYEPEAAEAQRLLDGVPVSYVIIEELQFLDVSRRYAGPVVRTGGWEEVFASKSGLVRVYRRIPPGF